MHRFLLAAVLALSACGSQAIPGGGSDGGAGDDLGGGGTDLSNGGGGGGDGTPMQGACTRQFGTGMSAVYGRLDGFVWSVVSIGDRSCSGDSSHVHLQVKMNGAVYNIAVTAVDNNGGNVYFTERELAVPGSWSEGWHAGAMQLDYTLVGLHSTDFTATPSTTLQQQLKTELAAANHVSVFTTAFGPDGGHLVHRNNGHDGAIVLNPLAATPHVLMFHFANQVF